MENNNNRRLNENEPIDELFRKTLNGYSVKPSEGIWKGISRKLLLRDFSHFNLSNLSPPFLIGSIAGIALLTTVVFWILFQKNTPVDSSSSNLLFTQPQGDTIRPSTAGVRSLTSPPVSASILTTDVKTAVSKTQHVTRPIPATAISESVQSNKAVKTDPILYASNASGASVSRIVPVDCFLLTAIPVYSVSEKQFSDTILSFRSPGVINKIKKERPASPQFFSLNLGISPEITFHNTGSESAKWNFWTNLRMTYHVSRFSISTGAGLGYAFDDGIYRIEYKSKDSTGFFNEVVSYSVNPTSHEITYSTISKTIYDSITHIADDRTRNRYTYIQVPLLFGYQLFETNRLSLTLQAGPAVSLYVGKKESEPMIDFPNARIIRIDNTTPSRIKTNWQLWLNLCLEYRLTRQFSLFAEPYYKYYFQPMLQQENISAKNPSSFGLGIGLQFNFGKKKQER